MIDAHGGKLVNKIISKGESRRFLGIKYNSLKVPSDLILDLEKIAVGAYSPLIGFMNKDELTSVIHKMRLPDGTAWTIPIFFSASEEKTATLSKNEFIAIAEENGKEIGVMRIDEIFSFDKFTWAKKVFGTENRNHPGVNRLFNSHDRLIGGEIWMFNRPDYEFDKFSLFPHQTRGIIAGRNWNNVAGFQTRNVPHRAHEYLQKIALSITDGILIHPIIGWKKDGDFKPETVINAYKTLIKHYFPKDSVIFAGLATAMRYAGPREAVFHAIIRKNYGCTHFIVGRDHAGVGNFYGLYDAHKIFDKFPDIGIIPLLLKGPYYCTKCKDVVSIAVCPHKEKWHKQISGTIARKCIKENKKIPRYIMREEVYQLLKSQGKKGLI